MRGNKLPERRASCHTTNMETGIPLPKKKLPRFREAKDEGRPLAFEPTPKELEDERSRYLAANNRNFGTNLAFVIDFVPKS